MFETHMREMVTKDITHNKHITNKCENNLPKQKLNDMFIFR